jgi:O-antigen/teichoic acid export membrane protein
VAVGLFGFGRELVDWLLGDQWAAMVPTLEILALAGLARSIQSTAVPVFMATGRPKVHTEINTLRAVVLCALIYPFSKTWGVPGVACAVLASCLVSLLGVSWRIHRVLEVRPGQFCVSIIAPVLAALTALALVAAFKPAGAELETGRLCALLLAGAAAYLALSLAADRVLKFGLLETARGAWRQLDFWRSSRLAKAGRPR